MVLYNAGTRELTAKIVYYGPGLCGKTTNLQLLHDRLDPKTVGKLMTLSAQADRTIYFDLLPVELGEIKGYKIRFQLATVPGQTAFNETRRVVLRGTDGVVFVADSQWTMLPKNLESWQNLKDNLKANGISFEKMPVVVQYNKRDLTDILSVDAIQEALGLSSCPSVEAVASAGRGVTETFKLISKLTFVDLLRRLQGRRPEEAGAIPAERAVPATGGVEGRPGAPAEEAPALEAEAAAGPPAAGVMPPPEPKGAAPDPFPMRAGETAPREEPRGLTDLDARLTRLEEALFAGLEAAGTVEPRVRGLEELAALERQSREAAEKSLAAEIRSLSTREEQLHREVALAARRIEEMEASLRDLTGERRRESEELRGSLDALRDLLEEKTVQGRREAEDIRSQIAPLLETHAAPQAREEELHAEFNRLRESLADSLGELSERLRNAVKGL